MDRQFWQTIIEDDYAPPQDQDLAALSNELLSYLGAPNPELRDTFAYSILARWMLRDGIYAPDDLRAIVVALIPNLSKNLGEQETDSVFLRSYSVLILSLIVFRDNQIHFLDEPEVSAICDAALEYMAREIDLRSYVPGKGLANAVGHMADLLRFLARNRSMDETDLVRIMESIADLLVGETAFIFYFDEDDRLALVIAEILRRNVLTEFNTTTWLGYFEAWRETNYTGQPFDPVRHATYRNIKDFLRALYCRIDLLGNVPEDVAQFKYSVLDVLRGFSL